MMRWLGIWCVVGVALLGTVASSAETLRIVPLVTDGEVLISFELADAYTQDVRDAIASGLRTTFTYDVELRMPVAGWVDRTIATAPPGPRCSAWPARSPARRDLRLFRRVGASGTIRNLRLRIVNCKFQSDLSFEHQQAVRPPGPLRRRVLSAESR